MFKKPTRKQLLVRRVILSAVATVSVFVIVTVTVLFMLGYRLDGVNGQLEQGALLQFDSNPNGATVLIDGKSIGSQTATKQTVIAGTHTINMQKSGYEKWSRTLQLTAGTLTWLDYARLVPIQRPVDAVGHYPTLTAAQFSPDLKWVLLQTKVDSPTFRLVDLRSQDVKGSDLTLTPDLYSEATTAGVTHTFSLVRWNSDGRYVLIKHAYKDQTEWLMIDTQDATKDVNITRLLSANFSDIQFAGSGGTTLYGLTTDGVIRKLDLSAGTMSRGFVTQVKSFSIYDNSVVTYVGTSETNASTQVVGVYRDGDDSAHVLQTVNDTSTPLHIAASRYFSDDYIAIAVGQNVTLLKGSFPSGNSQDVGSLKQFTTLQMTSPVTALSFSPKGDYMVVQAQSLFTTYEIEHQRSETGVVTVANNKPASDLKWLDAAHLWNDDTNSLVMRDFDGDNAYVMNPVVSGFDVSLSQNGRYLYSIGKASDGTYTLQRIQMILQ
ncbi:MAG TPA: PEGA domain-containing protein [Dongiaceae bacterium]|nr:PEGA domain-containing protein [Dongiaceae bacterium]